MTDKDLFEKLKREGECWHELIPYAIGDDISLPIPCGKCGQKFSIKQFFAKDYNTDFSTWEGFGWMWERAQEKDWFFNPEPEGKVGFIQVYGVCETDRDNNDHFGLPLHLTNPTRFRDALKEFLVIKDAGNNITDMARYPG